MESVFSLFSLFFYSRCRRTRTYSSRSVSMNKPHPSPLHPPADYYYLHHSKLKKMILSYCLCRGSTDSSSLSQALRCWTSTRDDLSIENRPCRPFGRAMPIAFFPFLFWNSTFWWWPDGFPRRKTHFCLSSAFKIVPTELERQADWKMRRRGGCIMLVEINCTGERHRKSAACRLFTVI